MSGVPELDHWIERARARRRERPGRAPLAPGIVPEASLEPAPAWRSAATALVTLVGGRAAHVGFGEGPSFANLERGLANLDPRVLGDASAAAAERFLGLAAHEGGHFAFTPRDMPESEPLPRWLRNVLEDERIECRVAERFPALAHPLSALRGSLGTGDPERTGILETFFVLVRAPERLGAARWERHESWLGRVMDALDPFPRTPEALSEAVRRVLAALPEAAHGEPVPAMLQRCAVCGHDPRRGRLLPDELWAEIEGLAEDPVIEWIDADAEPLGYEALRAEQARDAARLAEVLQAALPPRTSPRRRRGRLDRRRLHATAVDDRLFCAPDRGTEGLALALVADLSSSMRGACERTAQRLCVSISEAAAALGRVRLYAYGHRADANHRPATQLVRFATPARGPVHALGKLPMGGNNRDAHALAEIARDLRRREGRRRGRRVAVLVSDAQPNARGFRGRHAVEATRESLRDFERAWGPALWVATKDSPVLREIAMDRRLLLGPDGALDGLPSALAAALRR